MKPTLALPDIPSDDVVNEKFETVLVSETITSVKKMDLPPDKARTLRSYDLRKKWEMICDEEKVTDQGSPAQYIQKLQTFLLDTKKSTNKKKQKKLLGQEKSTTLLKHLEISLRTNNIDWVKQFLNEENNGLQVLIDYLKLIQDSGGLQTPTTTGECGLASTSSNHTHLASAADTTILSNGATGTLDSSTINSRKSLFSSTPSSAKKVLSGKNQGVPEDDIHVCIQCLRAIMNNKFGFNMVFCDSEAIYCIARSILHHSLRTRSLVLELLAAVCLVKGGHELITGAFDRFQTDYHERRRFETLLAIFREPCEFYVDFMVACMQFVNIVVHSVNDMNYRIYLQHEFTLLGLDDYLDELMQNESDVLKVQVRAYLDNTFDVGQLYEDSELKQSLSQMNDELNTDLSRMNERLQEVEANYMVSVAQLDNRLLQLSRERQQLMDQQSMANTEMHTLRRELSEKDRLAKQQQAQLESKIMEIESMQSSLKDGLAHVQSSSTVDADTSGTGTTSVKAPPPPPACAPPPPPPPPPSASALKQGGGPPAPPPPPPPGAGFLMGGPNTTSDVNTINKRHYQPRYKLPMLNWSALKPNQVKDTVFFELDDDKIMDVIDFEQLESSFKIGGLAAKTSPEQGSSNSSLPRATPIQPTILNSKRLQNVGITRRKLAVEPKAVMSAVHRLDLTVLSLEKVEMLQRCLPTEEEKKALNEYESSNKPLDKLTEEERFVLQLCRIERLQHKLNIMAFMGNFTEIADLIDPQFTCLTASSKCVREAKRFHQVLEVVLAFGNYMNSSKRGGVFGFKIQSLDSLSMLRSKDNKSLTLLHVIAATIRYKFPHLIDFHQDLKFIEKASGIALDSVLADMNELDKGYKTALDERQRKAADAPQSLVSFLQQAEQKMLKLTDNSALAQNNFKKCVEFYGESVTGCQPNAFFTYLVNFVRNFKQADTDNIEWEKAAKRAAEEERRKEELLQSKRARANGNEQTGDLQQALNNEMANRLAVDVGGPGRAKRSRSKDNPSGRLLVRSQHDMGDGTLDQMINDLRNEPYQPLEQVPRRVKVSSSGSAGGAAVNGHVTEVSRTRPPPPAPPARKR